MDAGFKLKLENPRNKANIVSKLFFGWMLGLFYKAVKKGLEVGDMYKCLKCNDSEMLADRLEKNWEIEQQRAKYKNTKPSLLRAISKTFFWNYAIYGVFMFIFIVILRSPQPLVLAWLIQQFSPVLENTDRLNLYTSGSILIAISLTSIVLYHHTNYGQLSMGMRIRIATSSLIYRKIMRLNKKSLGGTAAGQVVNLLSNDVSRFDMVCTALHFLWIMPFQVALVTYFLWQEVGISCLAGVASMAMFSLPVQGFLGRLTSTLRLQVAQKTDTRVKIMSEIISGIQVIKMYAWEKPFEIMVGAIRSKEIDVLTKTSYLRGIFSSCSVFIERATLFLTVLCYVLLGFNITADKVFSMAQFFNLLQMAMAIFYPMAISYGAEAYVSVKRLEKFLVLEERQQSQVDKADDGAIRLSNVFAPWVQGNEFLKNINLYIPQGTLCAVIGPVGAGKSSLLQLLLGELPPSRGKVQVGGETSYASQEPWLFASTVRKNILFGKEYNSLRYKQVVKACALERDFDQLPHRDKTVVGDRGVSLSGGQRARINLARAVYREADIYLLDDPLSAVDTHVGKHLFEKCIANYLRNKTRILVTHQLQHLKKADIIVVLNEGRIEAMGSFEDLTKHELDFTKLLAAADETTEDKKEVEAKRTPSFTAVVRKPSVFSLSESLVEADSYQAVDEEEVGGRSGESPLKEYIKAVNNWCLVAILTIIAIMAQVACTGTDYWVAFWTRQEELRHSSEIVAAENLSKIPQLETVEVYNYDNKTSNSSYYYSYTVETHPKNNLRLSWNFYDTFYDTVYANNDTYTFFKTTVALYLYGALILFAIILTFSRAFLFFKVAMRSSKNLHTNMFHCLLKAPMRFFDTNPTGRVLNRFSKDMGAIDELLPRVFLDAITVVFLMVGILLNVILANYYMVAVIIVMFFTFIKIVDWFVKTARNVKHLEGIAKSPMFSHISSTLNGLTTIRASKAEKVLIREFDDHQNVHTSSWFLTIMCQVSFGLWIDIICVIFVFCVVFGFVIAKDLGNSVNNSLAGLAISQSLILTGMVQHGLRQVAEVINQLTSVERVLQYTKLENEGPFETPKANIPKATWPSKGHVCFRNLSLRYAPDEPPVLKNLSFVILPTEKVGIVGRTGAGKSSLISALFRLAPLEGQILVDGIDTTTIGLTDLRKKISIIPQEPVLFSATLRYNLDPFGEFNDTDIWNALGEVELRSSVSSLDFMVTEGGSNFSLGQRQLVCLARAILRNNKILVLDEATANVDPKTDALIQATIRRKFKDCTVLTIAHRLNTIMDSDKVLVMGGGQMLEFDHPHNLLQDPEGHFHKMVLQTGPSMTLHLKDVAFKAWQAKKSS